MHGARRRTSRTAKYLYGELARRLALLIVPEGKVRLRLVVVGLLVERVELDRALAVVHSPPVILYKKKANDIFRTTFSNVRTSGTDTKLPI